MKIIVKSKDELDALIVDQIKTTIEEKPNAVIGLDAGKDLTSVYQKLAEAVSRDEISLKQATFFATCEYVDTDKDNPGTRHQFLNNNLFSKVSVEKEQIHFPCTCSDDAEELKKYDDAIEKAGGLDLLILGIGNNGSIGFNEPATPFDTYTHTQMLTDKTKALVADDFNGQENVPDKGVTMGIKTMMSAKNVALIATGEEKVDIIHKVVYGKTVTFVPASMLQIHMNMVLYLDEAAAADI